ncbi:MAG: lamin tail domain-containing protein [Rubripirellula sp.]
MKFPFARQTRAAEPRLRSSKHRSELKSLIVEQLEAPLPTKKAPTHTRPPMQRVDAEQPSTSPSLNPRISQASVSPAPCVSQTSGTLVSHASGTRSATSAIPVRRIHQATDVASDESNALVLDAPKVKTKVVVAAIDKSPNRDRQSAVFPFVAFAIAGKITGATMESATEFTLSDSTRNEVLVRHPWSAVADISCSLPSEIDVTSSRLVSGFQLTTNGAATWSAVTCSAATPKGGDGLASNDEFFATGGQSLDHTLALLSQQLSHTLVPTSSRFAALGRRYLILPNRFSSRPLRNFFGRITATSSRVSMDQIQKVRAAHASIAKQSAAKQSAAKQPATEHSTAKQSPAPKSLLRIFNGEATDPIRRPTCEASVANLRITDIDECQTADGGSVEYVELENFGTQTISLAGVALVDAVNFRFDSGKIDQLEPGEFVWVVRDESEMASSDGHDLPVAGQFEAAKTANDHATVTVLAADGSIIQSYVRNPNDGTWHLPQVATESSVSLHRVSKNADALAATESSSATASNGATASNSATATPSNRTDTIEQLAAGGTAQVIRRGVSYANAPSSLGPIAIAANVTGLLPGEKATSANYTNYLRGLTQVFIDVDGLPSTQLSEDDFGFKVGNCEDLSTWHGAPSTSAIDVATGAGEKGSSRVAITWADHAIQNQWLQVTMLASEATGLAMDDVFYVGHQSVRSQESRTTAKRSTVPSPTNRLPASPPAADEPYDVHGEALRMILAPLADEGTPHQSKSQKILTFSRRGPQQNPTVVDSIFTDKSAKTRLSRAE